MDDSELYIPFNIISVILRWCRMKTNGCEQWHSIMWRMVWRILILARFQSHTASKCSHDCSVVLVNLFHSEWPKLHSFGHSECNRVFSSNHGLQEARWNQLMTALPGTKSVKVTALLSLLICYNQFVVWMKNNLNLIRSVWSRSALYPYNTHQSFITWATIGLKN